MPYITKFIVGGQLYEKVNDFALPPECAHEYNMSSISIAIRKGGDGLHVYVPRNFYAYRGNPVHWEWQTEPEMISAGWRKLCVMPVGGWDSKYSERAFLNWLDKIFRRYPYT